VSRSILEINPKNPNSKTLIMKNISKYALRILLSISAFAIIYGLAQFVLSRLSVAREADTKPEVTIYIRSNGVHTDLVLPVKNEEIDWSEKILFANTAKKDTNMTYVGLGWGDKGFYLETPTWADLKFSTAFKAAFALGGSAIHATYYADMQESTYCRKIDISQKQYARLVHYVLNSFRMDMDGDFSHINTKAVYGDNDAFYEARKRYNLFYTCNTWANNGLKSCGQKAAVWTIFDTGIFYHYP
jgi:uncharacterized protein (TIGR02117 family)